MRFLIIAIILMPITGCGQTVKESTYNLYEQYSCIFEESLTFLEEPNNKTMFLDSMNKFIQNYEYKMDYSSKDTVYNFHNGRLEPVILPVFLFNNNYSKALIPLLYRTKTINNQRLEIVYFISAAKEQDKWLFKISTGSSLSYSYESEHPTLSDQEITIRVLNVLISQGGYFYKNTIEIDESFFAKGYFKY